MVKEATRIVLGVVTGVVLMIVGLILLPVLTAWWRVTR